MKNKNIIVISLIMFLFGLIANLAFAESDGTDGLVEKVVKLNEKIHNLSTSQSKNYKKALRQMRLSSTYQTQIAEMKNLNGQFREVLAQYKPSAVSWADFDPLEHYQIDEEDAVALKTFIGHLNDVRNDLKGIMSEMKNLIHDIRDSDDEGEIRATKTYYIRNPGRTYRYVYPRSSTYYYGYPTYSNYYDGGYYYNYPYYRYNNGYYPYYRHHGVVGSVVDAIF